MFKFLKHINTDAVSHKVTFQLAFTCSKSTIETLEKGVKYVKYVKGVKLTIKAPERRH